MERPNSWHASITKGLLDISLTQSAKIGAQSDLRAGKGGKKVLSRRPANLSSPKKVFSPVCLLFPRQEKRRGKGREKVGEGEAVRGWEKFLVGEVLHQSENSTLSETRTQPRADTACNILLGHQQDGRRTASAVHPLCSIFSTYRCNLQLL